MSKKKFGFLSLLGAVAIAVCGFGEASAEPVPARPGNLGGARVGSNVDVAADLSAGPAMLLMGGGSEVTAAFRDRAFPIINGGDIVVIRTSGGTGYNSYFLNQVHATPAQQPNSVDTLIIDTRAKADLDYVEWALSRAEMIWIAGGDQSTYTDNWRGTKVEQQLRAAWARGAVIGGTSAGMAVASEFIYDPGSASSLTTATAAANPYNNSMRITDRIIDCPFMDGVITDTHFRNRDRMGRSMAMMAYLRQEGRATSSILGVAASEQSSIFIDKDGVGIVDVNANGDAVYILEETGSTARTQVATGQPLIYENVRRYKLKQGDSYNFATRTASVTGYDISINGNDAPNVYTPAAVYEDVVSGGGGPVLGPGVVYFEDFEGPDNLTARGFSVTNGGGAATWTISNVPAPDSVQGRSASITFNAGGVKDDWLITPFFPVEAGTEYIISFWYLGGGNSTIDQFDLYGGTVRTPAGMQGATGSLFQSFTNLRNTTTPAFASVAFTPSATGNFALAFHANSPANQNVIRIDDIMVTSTAFPPAAAEVIWPIDQDVQVYKETWISIQPAPTASSHEVRMATFASDLDLPGSVVATLTDTFFFDPGTLAPGETYYIRVDAVNDFGTTLGPTNTVGILNVPFNDQALFYRETFESIYAVNGSPDGYPALPKGWDAVDLDGQINVDGFAGSWYRAPGSFARTGSSALTTRYNQNGNANNDWVFFPVITTPPGQDTVVEFYARTGSGSFTETVEVRYGSFANEAAATIDPADYTNLLGTISVANTTYQVYRYTLPANEVVRFALRYASADQSRFVIDDIRVYLEGPPFNAVLDWSLLD